MQLPIVDIRGQFHVPDHVEFEETGLRFALPSVPPFLDVDLTNCCNARCTFCSVSATSKRRDGEMQGSDWLAFFKSLAGSPIFRVALLGGEPLLVPEIYDIVSFLKSEQIDTRISTNGYLLSGANVRRLKAGGLSTLQISLDAPDARMHDASRGVKGLFDRATSGIAYARSLGMKCVINFLVMRSTLHLVPGMIKLANGLGVTLSLSEFKPVGGGTSMLDQVLSGSELEALLDLKASGVSHGPYFEKAKNNSYCYVGLDRLYLSETGDVYPCDLFRDYSPALLGNIKYDTLQHLWRNSAMLNYLRKYQVDGPSNPTCNGCGTKATCKSGCLALAAIHKGDPFLGDPRCF